MYEVLLKARLRVRLLSQQHQEWGGGISILQMRPFHELPSCKHFLRLFSVLCPVPLSQSLQSTTTNKGKCCN